MRRHYLYWSIAVFGIVATGYGAYTLSYNLWRGNGFLVPAFIFLIAGILALVVSLILYISVCLARRKKKNESTPPAKEQETKEEEVSEPEPAHPVKPESKPDRVEYAPRPERTYEPPSRSFVSTIYVKQIGYGPILRINGARILDMRSNTYYQIEGNMVMQDGYGPVFEIGGNQIRGAFGGSLYEVSGSNINKVFGGFYASADGNYITVHDGSAKYEMTESLSKKQLLVVAALLFGRY